MGETCRMHREIICLIGKPEGKKSLASMWRKWEDDHRETVVRVTSYEYVCMSLHYKI
jgi:hypothetical protein